MKNEKDRVDRIGDNSSYSLGINGTITSYSYQQISHFLSEPILELGPAEGHMTHALVNDGYKPILVEGSTSLATNLVANFPNLEVIESLFEDFITPLKFNSIIMGHVLEHVEHPEAILRQYADMLTENGRIIVTVPNANSLHRQAAVAMGLLKNVYELNEADIRHGHRRVFDQNSLSVLFTDSKLEIEFIGGYWLKPLANYQIEKIYDANMIEAFVELGSKYPEIAGEIILVASLKK